MDSFGRSNHCTNMFAKAHRRYENYAEHRHRLETRGVMLPMGQCLDRHDWNI